MEIKGKFQVLNFFKSLCVLCKLCVFVVKVVNSSGKSHFFELVFLMAENFENETYASALS